MRTLHRYWQDRGGNFAVWMALAAVPVLGAAGLATNVAMAVLQQSQMQDTLDGAVLAGTTLTKSASAQDRIDVATNYVANLDGPAGRDAKVGFVAWSEPKFTTNGTSVIGFATLDIFNPFAAFAGPEYLTVSVGAEAKKRASNPICIHALNKSAPRALEIYGNATLDATNCAGMANSSSGEGIKVYGAKSMAKALEFGVTGNFAGSNISPTPFVDLEPVEDLFAALPLPAIKPCADVATKLSKTEVTLQPGTYCGGIDISPGSDVTLAPGIYVLLDGPLAVGANSRLSGTEVVLALVGENAVLNINSGSEIRLTSPLKGRYANVQVMSDRKISGKHGEEWSIISSTYFEYDGALYLPEQDLWIKGKSEIRAKTVNLAMVADQFWFQDASSVIITQENQRGVVTEFGTSHFQHSARLTK